MEGRITLTRLLASKPIVEIAPGLIFHYFLKLPTEMIHEVLKHCGLKRLKSLRGTSKDMSDLLTPRLFTHTGYDPSKIERRTAQAKAKKRPRAPSYELFQFLELPVAKHIKSFTMSVYADDPSTLATRTRQETKKLLPRLGAALVNIQEVIVAIRPKDTENPIVGAFDDAVIENVCLLLKATTQVSSLRLLFPRTQRVHYCNDFKKLCIRHMGMPGPRLTMLKRIEFRNIRTTEKQILDFLSHSKHTLEDVRLAYVGLVSGKYFSLVANLGEQWALEKFDLVLDRQHGRFRHRYYTSIQGAFGLSAKMEEDGLSWFRITWEKAKEDAARQIEDAKT